MACQLVEQFILPGDEITLIEVIADDERLKRHALEVRRNGSVSADPCDTDRHGRHIVEPAERSDCLRHL